MASRREPIRLFDFVKQVALLLGLLAATAALIYFMILRLTRPSQAPARTWIDDSDFAKADFARACGSEAELLVTVVYSPDKGSWMKVAAETYMARCKNTQIRLVARPDLAAIEELLAGTLEATAWSPSDSIFISDFEQRHDSPSHLEVGGPLLHSPIVLLTWADRRAAIDHLWPGLTEDRGWLTHLACAELPLVSSSEAEPGQPPAWAELWTQRFADPLTRPRSPSLAELDAWQRPEFIHNIPTRTSVGLITLLMMVKGYVHRVDGGGPDDDDALEEALDRLGPGIEGWLRRCEGDKRDFNESPRTLVQRMFQRGPDGFDGVITYEHLALDAIEDFSLGAGESEAPAVRVVYPHHSLITDHPLLFLSPDQGPGAAARRFFEFMRGPALQREAVMRGLRPAELNAALIAEPDPQNPFLRLREFGVPLRLDARDSVRPGGSGLRALIDLWSDATGRF